MWALILNVTLNFQSYPLMNLGDGQPVYMRTTTFRVAVGQFPDKATCEAYTGYQNEEFVFQYTDNSGLLQTINFTNVPTRVVGCAQVL